MEEHDYDGNLDVNMLKNITLIKVSGRLRTRSRLNSPQERTHYGSRLRRVPFEREPYSKAIRSIEKCAIEWAAYQGIEKIIKRVSSTIPIMDQLHNDELIEHYWNQRKEITGADFQKSVDFKLEYP